MPTGHPMNALLAKTVMVLCAWAAPYYAVSWATSFSDNYWGLAVAAGWLVAVALCTARDIPMVVAAATGLAWLVFDLGLFFFASESSYPDRPESLTFYFFLLLVLRALVIASPVVVGFGVRALFSGRKSAQA